MKATTKDLAVPRLRIQTEAILAARALPLGLFAMFDMWKHVAARVSFSRQLDPRVREVLQEGKADLGLGFADPAETVASNEIVGAPVRWCVMAHSEHSLGRTTGPVSVDELPNDCWLLLPDLTFGATGMADVFGKKRHRLKMRTNHLLQYVNANVGVAVVPDVLGKSSASIKRPLAGLAPLQVRLFLPDRESKLSSANQLLVQRLQRVMGEILSGKNVSVDATTANIQPGAIPKHEESKDPALQTTLPN